MAVFGLPKEWEAFEQRHARFLDLLPALIEASDRVVSRTLESDHLNDRLVFFLGRHVPEDFNEILVISANGYGVAGLRLLRSMFERVVTMMYLILNPEKCADFIDWISVEKRKTLNHLKAAGEDPSKYLSTEELQQVEDEYQRIKHRFPKKQHQWTKLDLNTMARQVGVGGMYLGLCYWPTLPGSCGGLTGMSTRLEATEKRVAFNVGAQRDEADKALLGGHT